MSWILALRIKFYSLTGVLPLTTTTQKIAIDKIAGTVTV